MDSPPKYSATFFLFEDISNMKDIKDQVIKGPLKAAVVNPILIYHLDQLVLAAHKCIHSYNSMQLKTKSIFTELLYVLFPTRSIRDALKNFGTQDDATTAIFVVFKGEEDKYLNGLESYVEGNLVSLDRIAELRDVAAIKKLYKIPNEVTDEETVLNSILTKMAAKELLL
ncbi:hypothetical protein JTE90_004387 [Oedothorax gibbosus]|uniref:EKC/KEOPS complex subunit CGI121 n=1 Tax=Oedothorax gibbosus TaxID=931172 RepID=A0AAV6UNS6_9ARAC|nr:hypothetical protein JTE90_004387 [Oedothorax gibbosus]